MAGVRVVTDSACDLPPELASELGIRVVPLTIRFGDQEFVDRQDLTPTEFWARCASSPVLPETSAPSAGAFETAFREAAAEGADGVVCVNLSSKLSATIQSARVAAQAVADIVPVRVVDSLSVTMGLGLMAVAAARAAAEGKGLDDVAGAAEDLVARTRIYGALDTLENLKKGGRVGGAQAMIGSMLSIKPIISVVDGVVEPESRQRTRSRSLAYVVEKVRAHGRVEHLSVLHGHAPDVEEFLDQLGHAYPRDEIVVAEVGAVIGTHSGPRVMGVAFHA
jgi:DegV family protein with EDD domain